MLKGGRFSTGLAVITTHVQSYAEKHETFKVTILQTQLPKKIAKRRALNIVINICSSLGLCERQKGWNIQWLGKQNMKRRMNILENETWETVYADKSGNSVEQLTRWILYLLLTHFLFNQEFWSRNYLDHVLHTQKNVTLDSRRIYDVLNVMCGLGIIKEIDVGGKQFYKFNMGSCYLVVFESYQHKAIFTNALGLPEHGRLYFFDNETITVERHGPDFYCTVGKDVQKIINRVHINDVKHVVSVVRQINNFNNNNWFEADSLEKLEQYLDINIETSARNKINFGIFRKSSCPSFSNNNNKFVLISPFPKKSLPKIRLVLDKKEEDVRQVKRVKAQECVSCQTCNAHILFDCGHQSYCNDCYKKWGNKCPICRENTKLIIRFEDKKKD